MVTRSDSGICGAWRAGRDSLLAFAGRGKARRGSQQAGRTSRQRNFLDTEWAGLTKTWRSLVKQNYSRTVIISLEEQIRFAKEHIPHRIAILLAPFDRSEGTPPGSAIGEAVLHGSLSRSVP
jgi:hypothetical protein